jgi:hypothetical protein
VTYQLPNKRSRIDYLLDEILCNDVGLQAAMASIKEDQENWRRMFPQTPLRGGDTTMECSQTIEFGILVESRRTKRILVESRRTKRIKS